MIPILSLEGTTVLRHLARSRCLLAFDFDGTLAPIVVVREQAAMRERTRGLLARLSQLYPCAVISGRSLADVGGRLAGTGVRHIVGNHGLEPSPRQADFEHLSRRAAAGLREALAGNGDFDLEEKGGTVSIHYRRATDPSRAAREAERAVDALDLPLKTIPGKRVLNVVPRMAPHKGDALRRLKIVEGADSALFVGDDVTDEDAFGLAASGEAVAVRIGRSRPTIAKYCLADQDEVDLLLERLAELREPTGGA